MKKIATSFLGIFLTAAAVGQGYVDTTLKSGGPDDYGYSWKTNFANGGPSFEWIDITGVGTQITGLGDDNTAGPFDVGFDFPYYWNEVSKFYVGSNGYIMFEFTENISSGGQASYFPLLPTGGTLGGKAFPGNLIAPFLSDLNHTQDAGGATNPGAVYYYTNNVDSLVISYIDVPFWTNNTNGWDGSNTFQVVFNKADSSVTFSYLAQSGTWNSSYNTGSNAAIIGLESIGGVSGLTAVAGKYFIDSLLIQFKVAPNTAFQLTDAAASSNMNFSNGAEFISPRFGKSITANITNQGNVAITSAFNVESIVKNYAGKVAQVSMVSSISSLTVGETKSVVHSNPFVPGDVKCGTGPNAPLCTFGIYEIATTSKLSDGVATNNTIKTELVVVDESAPSQMQLQYYDIDKAAPDVFGFEGGAVYIEPPYYPIDVTELQYLIYVAAGASPSTGFYARLWDDDGANGTPGTMLADILVNMNDVVANDAGGEDLDIHSQILDNPVTITEGGFYVSWQIESATGNIALGTDTDPFRVKSLRTYEVLQGSFGAYRSAASDDIMIGVITDASAVFADVKEKSINKIGDVYPNPVTDIASVDFTLDNDANVSFSVSNVIGQNVKSINMGRMAAGAQTLNFNVSELNAGVYFYTLNIGDKSYTKKFIVK